MLFVEFLLLGLIALVKVALSAGSLISPPSLTLKVDDRLPPITHKYLVEAFGEDLPSKMKLSLIPQFSFATEDSANFVVDFRVPSENELIEIKVNRILTAGTYKALLETAEDSVVFIPAIEITHAIIEAPEFFSPDPPTPKDGSEAVNKLVITLNLSPPLKNKVSPVIIIKLHILPNISEDQLRDEDIDLPFIVSSMDKKPWEEPQNLYFPIPHAFDKYWFENDRYFLAAYAFDASVNRDEINLEYLKKHHGSETKRNSPIKGAILLGKSRLMSLSNVPSSSNPGARFQNISCPLNRYLFYRGEDVTIRLTKPLARFEGKEGNAALRRRHKELGAKTSRNVVEVILIDAHNEDLRYSIFAQIINNLRTAVSFKVVNSIRAGLYRIIINTGDDLNGISATPDSVLAVSVGRVYAPLFGDIWNVGEPLSLSFSTGDKYPENYSEFKISLRIHESVCAETSMPVYGTLVSRLSINMRKNFASVRVNGDSFTLSIRMENFPCHLFVGRRQFYFQISGIRKDSGKLEELPIALSPLFAITAGEGTISRCTKEICIADGLRISCKSGFNTFGGPVLYTLEDSKAIAAASMTLADSDVDSDSIEQEGALKFEVVSPDAVTPIPEFNGLGSFKQREYDSYDD